MVPIPAEYMPDFWKELSSENPIVELNCLLPNGILVLLKVNYNATLADIKEDLWDEAAQYPLFGKLQADKSQYLYKIVNSMAEEEELHEEEARRLCDIRPTGAVLYVSERKVNYEDHSINVTIGHLIGKGLQDFDAFNSSEINDFRFNMKKLGDRIAKKRSQGSWQEKLLYQFPPRISDDEINDDSSKESNPQIRVEIKCDYEYGSLESETFQEVCLQNSFQLDVSRVISPSELVEISLKKKAQKLKNNNERVTDYVLKVCGRDEYLLLDRPLNKYEYIQDCIRDSITPSLLMVHIDRIPVVHGDYSYIGGPVVKKRSDSAGSTNTLRKKKSVISSWNITENYVITLSTTSKVNCDTKGASEIGIQVGLFHGGKPLCQPLKTEDRPVSEKCEVNFDVPIEFDIQVCNIPRNAKLCFVIYEVNKPSGRGTKSRKPRDPAKENQINAIAWANTSVYDFKGQLKTGAMTLYMWTYAEDVVSDEMLHPLGTVVSNPNTEYSTALTVIFQSYRNEETIVYPCTKQILEFARTLDHEQVPKIIDNDTKEACNRLITDVENWYDLHDQDRKKLWLYRWVWIRIPEIFPKLLSCIDWDKKEDVSQVIELLSKWPKLPVEKALELLDYVYADQEVRKFAVKCLKDVSDQDLLLYLLQLVQAIKHELYLECDLVKFLIERALTNQRVGHYLFWHLRSEMQVPAVSVRFGLILEAYCRGSQEHIPILQLQLKSIEKLKKCSEIVRGRKDKEKAKEALKECLSSNDDKDTVRSPLDPSYRCSRIRVQECRVMDSKMKPLWIVYENVDRHGEDVYTIMFKNGDDLRQDMLTLQMLKIMDRLWKREGIDLRMNLYNCISLEHRVGMIQVVLNAETIANIQKGKRNAVVSCFKQDSIYAWLKECNPTEKALAKAIEEFTFSCAGYCVATYVLGIADRHSDNIMIKQTGQLFHIDFGHILGHFKEKFGFKRERVPFVLTHEFVNVINKGQKDSNPLEFANFQWYCEKAFMILRKHGNLILSLFAMMISTGLPELNSEKDLHYIRETLALSKTDEEALEHFKAKFDEALSNSWKTSLNWWAHNLSKNNKP